MSAAAKLEAPLVQLLAVKEIQESPFNPRRSFDEAFLKELAADLLVRGMLQPILVRPTSDHFEVVFGAQRFRAAKLAKMKEVPVMVRDMDDQAALEAMLVENAKRQDIQPVEEADAYQQLHEAHGLSVAQIAKRVGRSKASVYARMKLTELGIGARKLIHDKRIDASVALLAARMPSDKLQEKFLKDATTPERGDLEPWSFREAARHARADYMVDLSTAQFDPQDEALLPPVVLRQGDEFHMGSCSGCPMRTGNQRDLFTDVKDGNVCTSPKCFRAKQEAHWAKVKVEAKREGVKILEGPATKGLWEPHAGPGNLSHKSGYISLQFVARGGGGNKRYADLLKGKAVEGRVLALDQAGFIQEIMTPEDLHQALKEIGYKRLADEHLVEEEPEEKPAPKKAEPAGKPSACYLCDKVIPPGADDCTLDGTGWAHDKCMEKAQRDRWERLTSLAHRANVNGGFAEEKPKKKPSAAGADESVGPSAARADSLRAAANEPPELASYMNAGAVSVWCPACKAGVVLEEQPKGPEAAREFSAVCRCGRGLDLFMDRVPANKAAAPPEPKPADKVWTKTYRDRKPKAEAKQPPPARPLSWDWKKSKALNPKAHAYAHSDPSVALCGAVLGNGGELPEKGDRYCDDCGAITSGKKNEGGSTVKDDLEVPDHCSVCGGKEDLRFCKPPGFMYCGPCRKKTGAGFEAVQQLPASEVLSEMRRENKAKRQDDPDRGPVVDVKPGETDEEAEARTKKKRATK